MTDYSKFTSNIKNLQTYNCFHITYMYKKWNIDNFRTQKIKLCMHFLVITFEMKTQGTFFSWVMITTTGHMAFINTEELHSKSAVRFEADNIRLAVIKRDCRLQYPPNAAENSPISRYLHSTICTLPSHIHTNCFSCYIGQATWNFLVVCVLIYWHDPEWLKIG